MGWIKQMRRPENLLALGANTLTNTAASTCKSNHLKSPFIRYLICSIWSHAVGVLSFYVVTSVSVCSSNVMATNDQVVFTITDKSMLKDAPPHILQKLAVDP